VSLTKAKTEHAEGCFALNVDNKIAGNVFVSCMDEFGVYTYRLYALEVSNRGELKLRWVENSSEDGLENMPINPKPYLRSTPDDRMMRGMILHASTLGRYLRPGWIFFTSNMDTYTHLHLGYVRYV
jgi:hypothetical protein